MHGDNSQGGPQFWNSLPKDIQNNQNLKSFKRNLKTFLISKY